MPGHGYGYRALARRRMTGHAAVTPPSGTLATAFATPPNAQWHAGQSAITLRADTSVTGYIAGTTLTVTALNGGAILEGQILASGAAAGTAIVKSLSGNGGVGDYVVSVAQTVGAAGAPASFVIPAAQVATVSDLSGGFTLSSADGEGPRLMTDALGRKFLRFIMPVAYVGSWLQQLTITGLDNYNFAAVAVCRVSFQGGAIACIGSRTLGTGNFNPNNLSIVNGMVSLLDNTIDYNNGAPPANVNRLWAGTQVQALGSAIVTDDGVGGTSNANLGRVAVNEQSAQATNNTAGRATGVAGFELGKNSTQSPGAGAQYAYIDLYELSLWTTGQMGTRAQMPARFDAAMAAAMGNFAIPPITDSLVILGDSRSVNGTGAQSANGADGSGYNIAALLTEPGSASAIPATTRVLNYAISGQGIGAIANLFDHNIDSNNRATPLMPAHMLGGGHDKVHFFSGINDMTGPLWPTDTFAAGSSGQADEMYGTNRTASFTATVANNDAAMTATGITGRIAVGSQIVATNARAGLGVTAGTASPFVLNQFQSPALSAVPATATLYSYKSVVERLLTRGFKVVWGAEIAYTVPEGAGTTRLRSRIAGAVGDVSAEIGATLAANLRVYDLSQITLGGQKPFGADYVGAAPTNTAYVDGVHNTANGKRLLVSGGDTPANGVSYNVTR